jgi:anti-sigma28 factor (negative regulator of flagellin synthesis)
MKVNVTFPIAGLEQYKAMRNKSHVGAAAETGRTDEIEFSSDAKLFSDTMKAAKVSLGERLRGSRIDLDSIKGKIESGAYEIDSRELANSIMMLQGYYERR